MVFSHLLLLKINNSVGFIHLQHKYVEVWGKKKGLSYLMTLFPNEKTFGVLNSPKSVSGWENQGPFDLLKTFTPSPSLWSTNQKKSHFPLPLRLSYSFSFQRMRISELSRPCWTSVNPSLLHIRDTFNKENLQASCIKSKKLRLYHVFYTWSTMRL